jgi:uncharacterized protein (TIGR00730 family)
MQTVCVFCGSRSGGSAQYANAARDFGTALARRGLGLVYGGGHVGLMGILADAVLAGGRPVVGVIPRSLADKELAHRGLSELIVVESMHDRKAAMADRADAFVALPGGYGTGDELFEMLTWAQLGMHRKSIGLLNVAAFFDPLLAWLDHMVREDFLKPTHRRLVRVAADGEGLLDLLLTSPPPQRTPKWITDDQR